MTTNGKPVSATYVEKTEIVLPNDANVLGNILGGRVMHDFAPIGFGHLAQVLRDIVLRAGERRLSMRIVGRQVLRPQLDQNI